MLNRAAWSGRKVLVTGHTGFKGSWLCIWLQQLGAEVIGYALPPAGPRDNFVTCDLGSRMVHLEADLRDRAAVETALGEHAPEVVFHLAAQSLVLASYDDPVETFETNVLGTVNLLDAVRRTPSVRALVNVTTDKVYENREWLHGYRERDRLGGRDPYSASKAASEIVTSSYRQSFFSERGSTAVATARAGNVLGGGDWAENRIFPDCIRALSAGEPIPIRNPDAVRPWQHVLDPLHGYLLLAERLVEHGHAFAEAWNFGPLPACMVPVGELVRRVVEEWGSGSSRVRRRAEDGHEAHLLHLEVAKAMNRLGWAPVLHLEQVVAFTVAGYRADCGSPETVYANRVEQIRAFEERVGCP